jgi:hypothetical protein
MPRSRIAGPYGKIHIFSTLGETAQQFPKIVLQADTPISSFSVNQHFLLFVILILAVVEVK